MSRSAAIAAATEYFDSGTFLADLTRRVAYRTEGGSAALHDYLAQEMVPAMERLGAAATIVDNPVPGGGPFLIARRWESDELPTVLVYGHADVVIAEPERWRAGLDPWRLTVEQDRWYGRGSADNKGQHTINLAALEHVLATRGGRLGFNLTVLIEAGEETGSAGLRELCALRRDELSADVLIASDGPRVAADRPTVFLGTRGTAAVTLRADLRAGAHHSGNWGGALPNPATMLANAIASIVDGHGRLLVAGLRPPAIPDSIRDALRTIPIGGAVGDPEIDPDWGEPGLTPAERVIAWNTLEVLSLAAGNPDTPVGAIPGAAHAHCHLRYVVGTDVAGLAGHLRAHLDEHGFPLVTVHTGHNMGASRTDPADPWVTFALDSLRRTDGAEPALLPNLGGSLPNDVFTDDLGIPTIWVPHSYPACAQHAPNEHLLGSLARQALRLMAGLFWDVGEGGPAAGLG